MSAANAPPAEILPKLYLAFTRNLASLTATSVLWGIYLITFTIAFTNLWRRRRELPCVLLALATVIMFGISTFFWASNIATDVTDMRVVLGETWGDLPSRIKAANATTQKVRYLGDTLFAFSYIIGDAVMAWRILVVSRWKLLTTVVLGSLWLGTTAMGLGLFGCVIHADWPPDAELPALCFRMGNVAWVLSLAFNGIATALLARIAWSHRNAANMISSSKRSTKVMRVLVLDILVVSGVIYFLIGLPRLADFAKLTLSPFTTRFTTATQVIEAMLGQLVGMYPTAVTTFLFYEGRVFGDNTTAGSVSTRPTLQFNGASRRNFKASDVEGSHGTTMVTLNKRQHSSIEDMSVDKV